MNETVKDLKSWLKRQIFIDIEDINPLIECFNKIIKTYGFRIIKQVDIENGVSIEAIFGTRIVAFLTNLIPIIGRHLPSGKRLGLKATIFKGNSIEINLNISPYMELFNTSEVLVLSQTADEKISDEYLAAHKIHSITKDLYNYFGLPIPDEYISINKKAFAGDILLSLLIYPLDGYKASKKIHIPADKGPKWLWFAFIIPELWYVWHEIWGVSILVILLEAYGGWILVNAVGHLYVLLVLFLMIRIISGRIGNKIFYYRYGRWINEKKGSKV
jgi:hypothetical protein